MKNNNLEKMIESLFECTCNRENPKTPRLYDKPITITFDGITCEIPFNALNYITLTNALCKIENTFEEYTLPANELIFDLMALEELCFNLRESMSPPISEKESNELYWEYSKAREQKHNVEEKLFNLLNLSPNDFWKLKEKLLEII